jgi:hypothetical protein
VKTAIESAANIIDSWADVWFGFALGLGFANILGWLFLLRSK